MGQAKARVFSDRRYPSPSPRNFTLEFFTIAYSAFQWRRNINLNWMKAIARSKKNPKVIVVPLLDGMLGAILPTRTWFGVLMSALGVAMLECSGSPPNVGDLLNFLSAIFFGIHMLRTEHISRSTKKESLVAILGYEVCVVALLSTIWVFIGGWLDGARYSNKSSWIWTWTELWDCIVAFPWIPALYTDCTYA
ncbi:uncharacterized protein LOC109949147 isoform X2 [Prunus persica]|uniref:uncharacterized protein LOC109949147 isoform X2 n=1 Tax=Prunus persica TaxID=3760 RepID=UPI0009AB4C36|nr:uncharacterized protein LOC109949147 isoform X2 [Prunus persica]